MTKEDFKKKYHGKSVKIEPSMQVQHLGEIAERPRRIQEMCKLMGLEAHGLGSSWAWKLIKLPFQLRIYLSQ